MDPDLRRTARGEPRCISPDAVKGKKVYLVKNVPVMRLTYQVRELSRAAEQNALTMIIVPPRHGVVSQDLATFVAGRSWIKIKRSR